MEITTRHFFTSFRHDTRMKEIASSRSSERKPLEMLVKGRMRSRPLYVEVVDVSEGGCKVKGRAGFAEVGESVLLRIKGIHTPVGKFVWVDGKYAGIAFDGKMHPAVIEHLYNERLRQKKAQGRGEKAA